MAAMHIIVGVKLESSFSQRRGTGAVRSPGASGHRSLPLEVWQIVTLAKSGGIVEFLKLDLAAIIFSSLRNCPIRSSVPFHPSELCLRHEY